MPSAGSKTIGAIVSCESNKNKKMYINTITLACDFKEVFAQAGLLQWQTLLKGLLSNSNLAESLTFLEFACRLEEDLFETMLYSRLKEIVVVDV